VKLDFGLWREVDGREVMTALGVLLMRLTNCVEASEARDIENVRGAAMLAAIVAQEAVAGESDFMLEARLRFQQEVAVFVGATLGVHVQPGYSVNHDANPFNTSEV